MMSAFRHGRDRFERPRRDGLFGGVGYRIATKTPPDGARATGLTSRRNDTRRIARLGHGQPSIAESFKVQRDRLPHEALDFWARIADHGDTRQVRGVRPQALSPRS